MMQVPLAQEKYEGHSAQVRARQCPALSHLSVAAQSTSAMHGGAHTIPPGLRSPIRMLLSLRQTCPPLQCESSVHEASVHTLPLELGPASTAEVSRQTLPRPHSMSP